MRLTELLTYRHDLHCKEHMHEALPLGSFHSKPHHLPWYSGVAKPGRQRPENSWTSYFRTIAICNDAVSYALLTSEHRSHVWGLILVKTCAARTYAEVMGQSYSRFKTDGISKIVSRTIWVATSKMQKFTRGACPQPALPPTKKKQTNKRVRCPGVVYGDLSCCLFWRCILNASAHELVCLCVFRETPEGVQQDEAQWWCLYGLDHFDAARCVHVALGHTLACTSCHGGMGSPLSAHWRRCQEGSDLPEDFVKYLWCHMDEYGWSWTETGVLCPSKCLPCSL